LFALLHAALLPLAQAEPLEIATDQALAIHVAPQGFARLGDAVSGLIPPAIPVEGGSGAFDCGDGSILEYTLGDMDLQLSIDEVAFTTLGGFLGLDIYGTLGSTSTEIIAAGECSILTGLEETCDLVIPTTSFSLSTEIAIWLDGGNIHVDAGEADFSLSTINNPLGGCLLADAIGTLLGQNPDALTDLIADAIEPSLADLPQTIEEALEDSLGSLDVETALDVLGQELQLRLSPTVVSLEDNGLVIGMGSVVTVDATPSCVDLTSAEPPADNAWPALDGQAMASTLEYDFGLFLGKHFMDQILYAAWASGGLCLDVEALTGFSFTGEFVAAFFGDEVTELVGNAPVRLDLGPTQPPTTVFDDDQPPISIELEGFALEAVSELDHRMLRLLQIDMYALLRLYIELSGDSLVLELPLSEDDFVLTEVYSELLPPGYSEGVPSLLGTALGSFAPNLPTLTIPSILGISLDALIWEPAEDQSWQGGYIFLDTSSVEPLDVAGCSADGFGCDGGGASLDFDLESQLGCDQVSTGCDDGSGCEDTGCSSAGKIRLPGGRMLGLMVILVGAAIRRRPVRAGTEGPLKP
jgi:hypothetical protein